METYIKTDIKKTYLVLQGKEGESDDYQMEMLKANEIPGILKTDVRYVDNCSHYYYDISGKVSLKTMHENVHFSCENMKKLVWELIVAMRNLQKYMLDGNCLLLDPEVIFRDKEKYVFCYYPTSLQDAREEFHRLTEFFVREVDYEDQEGVHFAYTIHKATMEENYSIEEIMRTFREETVDNAVEETETFDFIDVEAKMDEEDEKESEEKAGFWESLRRFLKKLKDTFFEEEEDL